MLDYCIQKASELPYQRHRSRHYCVIVDKRNRIIAEAGNSYQKTHPMMAKASKKLGMCKEYAHSEMLALVRSRGKGVKMYIARVDSNNKPCYSAPCKVCSALIAESQIESVEYTT